MVHIVLPRKKDGTRKVLLFMGTSRIRKMQYKTVTGINVTGYLIDCAWYVKRLFRRRHIRIMGKRAVIDTIGGGACWAYNVDADYFRIMASENSRKADIRKAKSAIKHWLLSQKSDRPAAAVHAQQGAGTSPGTGGGHASSAAAGLCGHQAAGQGGGSVQHVFTDSEIEEIKAAAANGIVSIWDYIRITTDILNRNKTE